MNEEALAGCSVSLGLAIQGFWLSPLSPVAGGEGVERWAYEDDQGGYVNAARVPSTLRRIRDR